MSLHCDSNYILRLENNILTNIKPFWNFIQKLKSNKIPIPENMSYNNITATSFDESAQLFAQFFSSVYSPSPPPHNINMSYDTTNVNYNLNLSSWYINEEEMFDALHSLNAYSGVDPDGVPPIILKECKTIITKPLHELFNLSLSSGTFPAYWKKSYIVPIFESGDKNNVINYRPISKL